MGRRLGRPTIVPINQSPCTRQAARTPPRRAPPAATASASHPPPLLPPPGPAPPGASPPSRAPPRPHPGGGGPRRAALSLCGVGRSWTRLQGPGSGSRSGSATRLRTRVVMMLDSILWIRPSSAATPAKRRRQHPVDVKMDVGTGRGSMQGVRSIPSLSIEWTSTGSEASLNRLSAILKPLPPSGLLPPTPTLPTHDRSQQQQRGRPRDR